MAIGTADMTLAADFATALPELSIPWRSDPLPAARVLTLNEPLAIELGLDPEWLRSPAGVAALTGAVPTDGATHVAQVYAGHQFGNYVPRLGDGRALLLGELRAADGSLRDIHLKGSGRTPLGRRGDGKALVGPMLREHIIGEAIHALGIPTTRALAVLATGERVVRETPAPGALLVRVARSHLRVGSFQYARAHDENDLLRRLADYAIDRHHPTARAADNPYLGLYDAVVAAQARLLSQWMLVGFIHGVMNTDNMTISGETIDYGPCAFLDAHDPSTVFSSIDHGGRYAYGNQPHAALWNLARLADSLLPLIEAAPEDAAARATAVLNTFGQRFALHMYEGLRERLGLTLERDGDEALVTDFMTILRDARADHSATLRALGAAARGDANPIRARFDDPAVIDAWLERWRDRLARQERPAAEIAAALDAVNPAVIPRNHLVEAALTAAQAGDLSPTEELLAAVSDPFVAAAGYTDPAPASFSAGYATFCGT